MLGEQRVNAVSDHKHRGNSAPPWCRPAVAVARRNRLWERETSSVVQRRVPAPKCILLRYEGPRVIGELLEDTRQRSAVDPHVQLKQNVHELRDTRRKDRGHEMNRGARLGDRRDHQSTRLMVHASQMYRTLSEWVA